MVADFPNLMLDELKEAEERFKTLMNDYEAYAVIKEELDEFWEEVKKRENKSKSCMLVELVQIATMCWRAAIDLELIKQ